VRRFTVADVVPDLQLVRQICQWRLGTHTRPSQFAIATALFDEFVGAQSTGTRTGGAPSGS
jgi:hypothetical protein